MDFGSVEAERWQIDATPDTPRRRQPCISNPYAARRGRRSPADLLGSSPSIDSRRANRPVVIRPSGRRNSHMPSGRIR
jgi:hypothetical protein